MQTFLIQYDRIATTTASAAEYMEATEHRRLSNRTATPRLQYAEMLKENQHRTASHKITTQNRRM
jgi:hypothetical protein